MKIRFLKLERHTNGRWPLTEEDLKILKVKYIDFLKVSNVEYLSKHCSDLSFRLLLRGPNWKLLFIKFTKLRNGRQWLIGRWPQSIKGGIYQQPLIGSSPNQENTYLKPWLMFHWGKFRGNNSGNFKCGSPQPSLFDNTINHFESTKSFSPYLIFVH